MKINFEGKKVLVTGAAQGLGKTIAEQFLSADAELVLWDVSKEKVEATAAEFSETFKRTVMAQAVDVSDADAVKTGFARVGGVDVLVNNAGVQFKKPALELTPEDWRRILAIDLDSALFCSQAAAPGMIQQRGGVIVNISSCVVGFGVPERVPYGVAKAGLVQLTRTLAVEWAKFGVRVNAVAPGYTLTEMVERGFAEGYITRASIEAKIAMGRLAAPAEIAGGVMFLASNYASYVTGQTLTIDGGYSITK